MRVQFPGLPGGTVDGNHLPKFLRSTGLGGFCREQLARLAHRSLQALGHFKPQLLGPSLASKGPPTASHSQASAIKKMPHRRGIITLLFKPGERPQALQWGQVQPLKRVGFQLFFSKYQLGTPVSSAGDIVERTDEKHMPGGNFLCGCKARQYTHRLRLPQSEH